MPLYDFHCNDCDKQYEALSKSDDTGQYATVSCPVCYSFNKKKLMSNFSFAFGNPVGTDRYENSHDYRYQYKAPEVTKQREYAASRSHVGANPYNEIDDITSGKHFGEPE